MMMRDDLPSLLSRRGGFDETTSRRIIQAGEVLQRVHAVTNHPLKEVIDAAVRALNLDIDTIVAQAVKNPSQPVNPTQARSPLQSVAALVDTYTQEIVEGVNPTLRGFMSWVDSLGQIEEDTAAVPDTPADVVLMTIHQAKGLEWDAVAVVSMQSGVFPSNQGGLHVELDAEHPGGGAGESWLPRNTRRRFVQGGDPAAVPAPVRVDAGILPRFPHDANPDDARSKRCMPWTMSKSSTTSFTETCAARTSETIWMSPTRPAGISPRKRNMADVCWLTNGDSHMWR